MASPYTQPRSVIGWSPEFAPHGGIVRSATAAETAAESATTSSWVVSGNGAMPPWAWQPVQDSWMIGCTSRYQVTVNAEARPGSPRRRPR